MAQTSLNYQWRRAAGTDVTPIMDLTREHFRREATGVWSIDEQWFARSVTVDIVNQFFNPGSAMVAVAETDQGRLLAYVWAERGQRTVWSSEEMVAIKIVHLDLTLSARIRLQLLGEMMDLWELWAESITVPVICSSTMRGEQTAFLRLHQRRGYDCRGSICYLRLGPKQTGHESNDGHEHADGSHLQSVPPV
jgi:hypothetical protein